MIQKDIDDIRAFNRFYTSVIGLLDKYILKSNYSLPEVRIMFELYHHKSLTANDIINIIHLDKGYLSRIIKQFEKKKLIIKARSKEDGRSTYISLSDSGTREFEILNNASNNQIANILSFLNQEDSMNLLSHMKEIKTILLKIKF